METAIQSKSVAYLRPDQVEEMEGERESLQRKLNNPGIQDKGAVSDQLRRLDNQLETQRPRPYASDEIDAAVRREKALREQWMQGILSHEEMRKAPDGATDRHIAWERKNKRCVFEWQNLTRRLNSGSDAREVASIERFRPRTNSMNMDTVLIQGKQFYLPPEGAATGVTFTDNEMATLRDLGLADTVALLTNEQRATLKDKFFAAKAPKPEPVAAPFRGKLKVYAPKREKRELTDAHKAALKAGRDRYNEAKAIKAAMAAKQPT